MAGVIAEQPVCDCHGAGAYPVVEDEGADGSYGQAGVQISGEIGPSMAYIGQDMRADGRSAPIARLEYRPTGPNSLDLEIFSASDLRR